MDPQGISRDSLTSWINSLQLRQLVYILPGQRTKGKEPCVILMLVTFLSVETLISSHHTSDDFTL